MEVAAATFFVVFVAWVIAFYAGDGRKGRRD